MTDKQFEPESSHPSLEEQNDNHRRGDRPRSAPISWPLLAVATVLFFVFVLVGDTLYGLSKVKTHLDNVRHHLSETQDSFSEGNLGGAIEEAQAAEDEANLASGAARRPSLVLAQFVAGVDRDAEALTGLVEAARLTTTAATAATDAARDLDLDDDGDPQGLFVDGRLDLDKMATVREDIHIAERRLYAAVILLQDLHPRLAQLSAPIEDVRAEVRSAFDRVERVRAYFDLVPKLLGSRGPRDYLLAFQAPSEARATGGLMAFFGVLRAQDGILKLEDVRPLAAFQTRPLMPVSAPPWFRHNYGAQGALRQIQQVNVSPNYPVVSRVLLRMYEQATGERLDGVLTMDPIALSNLMGGTGALRTSNPHTLVTPGEVVTIVLHDSYLDMGPEEQNIFLGDLLETFWRRIESGDFEPKEFSDGLAEALQTQHLMLYSAGKDQQKIEQLGLGGRYDVAGQTTQMVFNNNYGVNKVDYYLHREVLTEIALQSDGTALITTTVKLENRSPSGSPSYQLGDGEERVPGTNLMTLNVLMPPGSEVDSFEVRGEEREPFLYTDLVSPVAWDILEIPPGKQQTVEMSYSVPGVLKLFAGGTAFDFAMFPQPAINPDIYSLSVQPPPGASFTDVAGGDLRTDGTVAFAGTLTEPLAVRLLIGSN